MKESDIKFLDETIILIKEKDNDKSSFDKHGLYKFELRFLLCMDIVRFELQINNGISDLTGAALSNLFAFGTFEYYYRDFPEIYRQCSELFSRLVNYNEALKSNNSEGNNFGQKKGWIDYFQHNISVLLV